MISYNLAPIPIWPLRDNVGEPLANGYMLAYRDLVRSELKPVYQNIAGTTAYVQPIVFNAAGFQGPFYWASDENYYLEIFDVNGQLIKTVPSYNAPSSGGSGPITINETNKNYIIDSQFRFMRMPGWAPFPGGNFQLGISNWFSDKSNATAVDSINFLPFTMGSLVPPNNPPYYAQYNCTVAGSGEVGKYIFNKFQSVYSFQNTEMTFGLWARADINGRPLEIRVYQSFGTGGTPSPTITIVPVTFNLTDSWAQYQVTFTVPSVVGKILGTNSDDYLAIAIQFPLDTACTIQLTNVQLNTGNTLQAFEVTTDTNASTFQFPWINGLSQRNKILAIDNSGILDWQFPLTLGYSFEGQAALFALNPTLQVLPITPTINPEGWIAANRFTPTRPGIAFINAFYEVPSASGGVDFEIGILFNGSDLLAQDNELVSQPGGIGKITVPAQINCNGTGDFIELVGRFNGVGTGGAQLIFLHIQYF